MPMNVKRLKELIAKARASVTRGSYNNDRAIQVPGITFDSIREATATAKKLGLVIAEEYYGSIY